MSALFAVCACQETPIQKHKPLVFADEEVKEPYRVYVLSEGVYRIEDASDKYPAGMIMDEDGKIVRMNSCSDMYQLVGKNKALLIDLSNDIK